MVGEAVHTYNKEGKHFFIGDECFQTKEKGVHRASGRKGAYRQKQKPGLTSKQEEYAWRFGWEGSV